MDVDHLIKRILLYAAIGVGAAFLLVVLPKHRAEADVLTMKVETLANDRMKGPVETKTFSVKLTHRQSVHIRRLIHHAQLWSICNKVNANNCQDISSKLTDLIGHHCESLEQSEWSALSKGHNWKIQIRDMYHGLARICPHEQKFDMPTQFKFSDPKLGDLKLEPLGGGQINLVGWKITSGENAWYSYSPELTLAIKKLLPQEEASQLFAFQNLNYTVASAIVHEFLMRHANELWKESVSPEIFHRLNAVDIMIVQDWLVHRNKSVVVVKLRPMDSIQHHNIKQLLFVTMLKSGKIAGGIPKLITFFDKADNLASSITWLVDWQRDNPQCSLQTWFWSSEVREGKEQLRIGAYDFDRFFAYIYPDREEGQLIVCFPQFANTFDRDLRALFFQNIGYVHERLLNGKSIYLQTGRGNALFTRASLTAPPLEFRSYAKKRKLCTVQEWDGTNGAELVRKDTGQVMMHRLPGGTILLVDWDKFFRQDVSIPDTNANLYIKSRSQPRSSSHTQ